ncbi:choline transporter-like 2 isoform X2 [Diorhabda carinulata]|uniref:choline transporter-like 2 isoform X2 n=1 Tax=Diorhabda carinulata TaxID=1163345 RepID=UPI0025A0A15B|nr:choline transporter-like 2 isoform X2 [Diorhabda carinulata]
MKRNRIREPIPYDPDFNGPLSKRSCTDVLCFAIFIVFVAAWAGIGLYAILNGDPSTLLVPKDSSGRRCGKDTEVLGKPYLFFHDLTQCISPTVAFTGCPTPQVCVRACPTEIYVEGKITYDIEEYCVDNVCPSWILPSKPFISRCLYNIADRRKLRNKGISDIPGDEISRMKQFLRPVHMLMTSGTHSAISLFTDNEHAHEVGQNIVEDLAKCWWKILIGVLVAMAGCIVYVMILRWLASPMVWLSILGVIVGLGAGLYFSIVALIVAQKSYNDLQTNSSKYEEDLYYQNKQLKTKRDLWLTGVIVLSVVLLIILLMLIFLRKRILLAIALIKEGSKAVGSVTASLFFPIIPWVLQIAVISYSLLIGVFLASTGQPLYKTRYYDDTNCANLTGISDDTVCDPTTWSTNYSSLCPNASCKFIKMNNDALYPYLQAYNIFGFFWLLFFVIALGQMVLAGVFAQWYWTFNKRRLPFFAVTSAFLRTLRYHIGTLAFGSLILAICRMIRVALEYLDHKLKKYDNAFTKAVMCLLKCFFYCLEKFLKFLNKNAYIMCAIHGKNFCVSAKNAFMLLMRNILRVWVLDKVTDFLFFLSKVLLTLAVGGVSYIFFASELLPTSFIDNSDLNYKIVPVVLIMICTYLIASLFFSVYSMAVDTLFLCFLEDCERNDGSAEKPYYMSRNLMKIFDKKNKLD